MAQLAQDRSFRSAQRPSSYPADWYIEDDEPVPTSTKHDDYADRLKSTLRAWNERMGHDFLVNRELAFRWDERHPRVGVDPDVFVTEMPPREPDGDIRRVRTWEKGNRPPLLAIEIVSRSRPKKDYSESPEKHALLGTYELWVFDPHLHGYTPKQPPVLLQIFRRETNDELVQVYAGAGPYRSEVLDAWVMVIDGELVIANDREGKDRWPTLEEVEQMRADEEAKRADEQAKRADEEAKRADEEAKRADEEAKRADEEAKRADEEAKRADAQAKHANEAAKRADAERTEKEKALARIAELEALLAARK
ncbi:MAG: Uma2 family endonuclease [Polyangiaceae bacterium]|nr:Uma2 family endonuclease [Polyangiaceae bacterium]